MECIISSSSSASRAKRKDSSAASLAWEINKKNGPARTPWPVPWQTQNIMGGPGEKWRLVFLLT